MESKETGYEEHLRISDVKSTQKSRTNKEENGMTKQGNYTSLDIATNQRLYDYWTNEQIRS